MNSKITIFLFTTIVVALAGPAKSSNANSFTTNLNNSIKTLGGINCLVESVLDVENAANEFAANIKICNVKQTAAVSTILDDCNLLQALSGRIVEVNNNVCKNAEYNEKSDAKITAPSRCARDMTNKITHLYNFLLYSLNDLNQDIKDSCSENAVNDLLINLEYFPDAIEVCAKSYKKN